MQGLFVFLMVSHGIQLASYQEIKKISVLFLNGFECKSRLSCNFETGVLPVLQVELAGFWTEHKPLLSKGIKPEEGERVIAFGNANPFWQGKIRI